VNENNHACRLFRMAAGRALLAPSPAVCMHAQGKSRILMKHFPMF
jgi:hypothetical protein